MADPIPYVVRRSGGAGAAPDGSIPIALFGAGGGGGGGAVDSVNGQTGDVELGIADIPNLSGILDDKANSAEVIETLQILQSEMTAIMNNANSRVAQTEFNTYQTNATAAFEELEGAVATNTSNLANTTATANSAVQPNNLRLPILLTQAQYDALVAAGTVVAGQIYITT